MGLSRVVVSLFGLAVTGCGILIATSDDSPSGPSDDATPPAADGASDQGTEGVAPDAPVPDAQSDGDAAIDAPIDAKTTFCATRPGGSFCLDFDDGALVPPKVGGGTLTIVPETTRSAPDALAAHTTLPMEIVAASWPIWTYVASDVVIVDMQVEVLDVGPTPGPVTIATLSSAGGAEELDLVADTSTGTFVVEWVPAGSGAPSASITVGSFVSGVGGGYARLAFRIDPSGVHSLDLAQNMEPHSLAGAFSLILGVIGNTTGGPMTVHFDDVTITR